MPRPPFIEAVQATDPELYELVARNMDLAMSPGEVDAKTKVFIAMALDAFAGSAQGVKSLAQAARAMGASEGEIREVLRLAYFVAGNTTLGASRGAY